MFVVVDRTSKYAYVELHEKATREVVAQFLEKLIENVPFTIHTVLTDNGGQLTNPRNPKVHKEIIDQIDQIDQKTDKPVKCNAFDAVCMDNNIEHRLTLPYHPWTNGQVERMNRTIKEATVKKYYYQTHDKLNPLHMLTKPYIYPNYVLQCKLQLARFTFILEFITTFRFSIL